MITAENLKYLTAVPTRQLEAIALASGYRGCRYTTSRFLGLTNAGQFCYSVTFKEDGELHTGKVFLTYDPVADRTTLDF